MKRIISLIVLLSMVMTLGVAVSACKSGAQTVAQPSSVYSEEIPGGTADVSTEVLEALTMETSITMYNFGSGSKKWYDEFVEYYKEVYNGTVNYIYRDNEAWHESFLVEFSSGECPDLLYLYEKNFPTFTNRGVVYSNEELAEMGVVGLDHPIIAGDREVLDKHFTYRGKTYSFAVLHAEPDMVFVNEDLFKKYSVKSPSAYYAEGQWDWETFEKCAAEITRDTDGDGATDIWGYRGWDGIYVLNAAGGEPVSIKEDGTVYSTLDTPQSLQGLQNYINIYTELKCAAKSTQVFSTGSLAMIAWLPQNEYHSIVGEQGKEKYTFEWSLVPYPLDSRTNTENIRSGKVRGRCISTTADAVTAQGCVNYIIAFKAFSELNPDPAESDFSRAFTPEQLQMIADCTLQIRGPLYQGVGNLWHAQWDFWSALQKGGATPSEIVNTYKPLFDAQCVVENSQAEK